MDEEEEDEEEEDDGEEELLDDHGTASENISLDEMNDIEGYSSSDMDEDE